MRRFRTCALLLCPLGLGGCITGSILAVTYVYGQASGGSGGKTIGMNYHTAFPATWDAVHAQMTDMGYAPSRDSERKQDSGRLKSRRLLVELKSLKQKLGTRVEVSADAQDAGEAQRARALLNGVARQLGEFREVIRDYPADIDSTWAAANAQLNEMGLKPTKAGTVLQAGRGRIRVSDVWIELERIGSNATRLHIGFGAAHPEKDIERGRSFLDGVARRLAK